MKHGLVIGKFLPLHNGHEALIRFAKSNCDELIVLLGVTEGEPIPGHLRYKWLWETFRSEPGIRIEYTDDPLPDAPVSSRDVSKVWADYLSKRFPETRIIFSSEQYGEYLAEYMGIEHRFFDLDRKKIPVSGTMIRENPYRNWHYLSSSARSYFVKKICIFGPESTGKTVLTERLAAHYKTEFVPEVARHIIDDEGGNVTYEIIEKIGPAHADAIIQKKRNAERFLFVDTDVEITGLFSDYYFCKVPEFPAWVYAANSFDLYLFTETDTPYIEDPQRDSEHMREVFRNKLLDILHSKNADYEIISGSWDERFEKAIAAIEKRWPSGI
ncbi:MAG TPA: AAA family ATPase [Spirochaetota bacterium]|nr:AAA family ATPase [Spirochaetota bacterium]